MKIRICILIIIWGILYPEYLSSQESPYVFRQIGVVEGLPDNYVKSVFPISERTYRGEKHCVAKPV